jgi:NADH dehydrogenase
LINKESIAGPEMIFVAGGTGFIGGHLLRALKEGGRPVRCLARDPKRAGACGEMGFELAQGDITDRESLRGALRGVRTVVHLVGIIEERGRQTFKRIHVEGTANLVEEAKGAGVRHFFYQSAIGADLDSWALYHRTKAEAEEMVKASGIPFTIFRPSLVIGEGGGFIEKLRGIIRAAPVIPVPGNGEAKLQPIYVGDLVKCIVKAVEDPGALGRTYELGGPEHLTYNEIVRTLAGAMGVEKRLVHIPTGLASLGVRILQRTPLRPATLEQLRLINTDNICDRESVRKNFGFEPISLREALSLFISLRGQGR